MLYQRIKHRKRVFYCFSPHNLYIIKQMKKPKPCVQYTVIKHFGLLPVAGVFYISLVFSNARRVLSLCNTRLSLLYLPNKLQLSPTLYAGVLKRQSSPQFTSGFDTAQRPWNVTAMSLDSGLVLFIIITFPVGMPLSVLDIFPKLSLFVSHNP